MIRKSTKHNSQSGVVSLFTVLFFTLLISVLTIGFIRIMIQERRQATDDDLTARAYYAAESGVEEAKRALQQYYPNPTDRTKLNATTCDAPVGYNKVISATPSIGYSCMLLDTSPGDLEGTAPGDGTSLQWAIRSEGDVNFNKIRISWHSLSDPLDGSNVAFRNANTIPTTANWNSGGIPYPAMLRMQMFGYPKSGTFDRTILNGMNRVGFLNPMANTVTSDIPVNNMDANTAPQNVDCDSSQSTYGGYACQATIVLNPGGLDPTTNYIFLRLKSLYDTNGTKVKVELLNGSTVVDTADAQAMVDVTGYAGDVFRRVQARVTLPGVVDTSLLPEYAIDSGDDICKRFEVSDTTETLNGCQVR